MADLENRYVVVSDNTYAIFNPLQDEHAATSACVPSTERTILALRSSGIGMLACLHWDWKQGINHAGINEIGQRLVALSVTDMILETINSPKRGLGLARFQEVIQILQRYDLVDLNRRFDIDTLKQQVKPKMKIPAASVLFNPFMGLTIVDSTPELLRKLYDPPRPRYLRERNELVNIYLPTPLRSTGL